jgi:hypothetical protein
MKSMIKNSLRIVLPVAALFAAVSCSESFLKPDPLSFFEPSKTFTSSTGLEAAITSCDRQIVTFFYDEIPPICTDGVFSEMHVDATSDKAGRAQDLNILITPTADLTSSNANRIGVSWREGFYGLKYANTVVSNVENIPGLDAEVRDHFLGQAYFHRAFRYYFLCFQFGDIPLITKEITSPKFNLRSTKWQVIIEKMTADMEFAVAHVRETTDCGTVNRTACKHLLAKLYLAAGRFDDAIRLTTEIINDPNYALMTEPFGTFVNPMPDVHPITRNIIWDLHRHENKAVAANREAIHLIIDREDFANSRVDSRMMRNYVPYYLSAGKIITPDGKPGTTDVPASNQNGIDIRKAYGRGVAYGRGTVYSTRTIWDDPNDLRHSRETGNWMCMEDVVYNHPDLKSSGNPWYGKPLQLYNEDGVILCTDTLRSWSAWPHYKTWVESPRSENSNAYNGGACDWYVYRLAETYLIRAEANIWKGNQAAAMADINAIRTRAKCAPYTDASKITIGVLLDERARELYLEEFRKVELTRVAWLYCLTGKAADNGKTYTYDRFSQDNYWYDRIMQYTEFYNKGFKLPFGGTFSMSPYHVLWPVPQNAIDANREARINQNYGYSGYELNVAPIDNLAEAEKALDE